MRKNADELWRKNVGQIMKLYTALFFIFFDAYYGGICNGNRNSAGQIDSGTESA